MTSDNRPTQHGQHTQPSRPTSRRGPGAPPPGVPAPRGSTEQTPRSAPVPTRTARSLTASKVLAGGLAAATSAVLGSYFGAFGTVGGAAAGAVATTVSTTVYQRSIERAGATLRSRIPSGSSARPRLPDAARPRHLPRLLVTAVSATVIIFGLGIGAVTGVELVKGAPLSGGGPGTSVGRVLQPGQAASPPNTPPRRLSPDWEEHHQRGHRRSDNGAPAADQSGGQGPLGPQPGGPLPNLPNLPGVGAQGQPQQPGATLPNLPGVGAQGQPQQPGVTMPSHSPPPSTNPKSPDH
jgi:hypothetical protein